MITDERLTELRAQYGRIKHVTHNGVDLVFRQPSPEECDQHAVACEEGGAQKAFADRLMTQQTIVFCGTADGPDRAREAYRDFLKKYPYAWRSAGIGGAMARLTGVVQDEAEKKDETPSAHNGSPLTRSPMA
jgi:hypothetical protein